MFLHNDTKEFKKIIDIIASNKNIDPNFIEKDYYITMILKCLQAKCPSIIFKGGTSLSKCFGLINRFSEDIDISFEQHIGESKRNRLKNTIIKSISNELKLPIINWDILHSNNNVNKYIFEYQKVTRLIPDIQVIRSKIDLCPSAKPNINIKNILNNIIDSDYYKNDYKNVTSLLIYDDTSYDDCIKTLKEISETITFPIL